MSRPVVAIFSGRLLPLSETFILAQAEQLRTFLPYYVGARRVTGLTLPEERTLVVNQGNLVGKAKEGIFKVFGVAPQFTRQISDLKPSLIHAHFGVCGALALPIARSLHLPLVVTFHGLDATMTSEYARKESITTRIYLVRKETLKRQTNLFIAVSDFIKEKLLQQGFPENKIVSHYHGVNTDLFTPDHSIKREDTVLFVGRLAEKKGCEYLIKAMEKVQATLSHVDLVIIGDGELRAELEKLASEKLHRYKFLGLQSSSIVRSWMNRARILAVPSVTASTGDSEGLPTVIVEAQSMGLPVVGSFHAGIPQAVLHEQTGLLASEQDWSTLADHILHLLQNSAQWQDFSIRGRKRMKEYFNLAKQTQVLEMLYQKVIEEQF